MTLTAPRFRAPRRRPRPARDHAGPRQAPRRRGARARHTRAPAPSRRARSTSSSASRRRASAGRTGTSGSGTTGPRAASPWASSPGTSSRASSPRWATAVKTVSAGQRVSAEGHITAGRRLQQPHRQRPHRARHQDPGRRPRRRVRRLRRACPRRTSGPSTRDPRPVAATFDPLGNAVHTVMAANVSAKSVLISGVGHHRADGGHRRAAAGAARIYCTDINPPRLGSPSASAPTRRSTRRGQRAGSPVRNDHPGRGRRRAARDERRAPGDGRGLPHAPQRGHRGAARPPGARPSTFDFNANVIFKGCTVLGINGRRMWETWYQMEELLLSGKARARRDHHPRVPDRPVREGLRDDDLGRGHQGPARL
jgi:hypothetical protein